MVLTDVFSCLAGELSPPALHRLETAFGGGKTHTRIALTHLGFRGRELALLHTKQDAMGSVMVIQKN
ncbi:MAG TPA: hypothetical protein VNP04_32340 [Alphaproteobacteria bacterium]|nr:hypothetical protein [Alphaproteobacteria bacterium]